MPILATTVVPGSRSSTARTPSRASAHPVIVTGPAGTVSASGESTKPKGAAPAAAGVDGGAGGADVPAGAAGPDAAGDAAGGAPGEVTSGRRPGRVSAEELDRRDDRHDREHADKQAPAAPARPRAAVGFRGGVGQRAGHAGSGAVSGLLITIQRSDTPGASGCCAAAAAVNPSAR